MCCMHTVRANTLCGGMRNEFLEQFHRRTHTVAKIACHSIGIYSYISFPQPVWQYVCLVVVLLKLEDGLII